MDSPDVWRWIWLAATALFALGEMGTAGSFFLLPFAIGAGVAAILAFLGVDIGLEWLAFVVVSVAVFLAMRPLAKRLDRSSPTEGIGSKRFIGEAGVALEEIPAGLHELGTVRVHREEWRAESPDGRAIAAGTTVRIVDVQGTRLIVKAEEE